MATSTQTRTPVRAGLDAARAAYEALDRDERAKRPLWPAPYDVLTPEAAYRWLTECWWTFNDADSSIELVPSEPFVRKFCEEWVVQFSEKRPMAVEKSRRLVVSWMARGLETWVMGLSRGTWLIVDQTDKSAGEHLWRIHFSLGQLYERRPELRLRPHEARGAIVTHNVADVILPNGSWLTQSHQEAAASQGKGKTGITLEELSQYMAPAAFWTQAVLVTMGDATKDAENRAAALESELEAEGAYYRDAATTGRARSGGWVMAIANAAINEEWHSIKADGFDSEGQATHVRAVDLLADPKCRLMEGMAARMLPSGVRYLVIHYTADTAKRGDWRIRESAPVAGGLLGRDWRREMELNEEGYAGKPVYETYDDDRHCPTFLRGNERIPVIKGSLFIVGWDCGTTMRPGAVLIQLTQYPNIIQCHQLLEVTSTGNEPMSLFAPRVMDAVTKRIGTGNVPDVKHVGDGTIKNRMGGTGESAADVARRVSGIVITPMSNIENVRQSAVTDMLVRDIKDDEGNTQAFFILDGCCALTRAGFLGAYRFDKLKTSDGSVRWKPHPEKNEASEVHDALQYGAQGVRLLLRKAR